MTLSLLLAKQIFGLFLYVALGYFVVKIGLFTVKESVIISRMVVYICTPCMIIDAFQIQMTPDKVTGIAIGAIAAILVHFFMILFAGILEKPLHLNEIEKMSIIYSNAGNLIIPLVGAVLGEEWVFYTAAYSLVQTVFMWTHGYSVMSGRKEFQWKNIFLNVNMIAIFVSVILFVTQLRLPELLGSRIEAFGSMIGPCGMLIIGMVIGDKDLRQIFSQKRPYGISAFRLLIIPAILAMIFGVIGHFSTHPDIEYILLIVFLAGCAPAAAMVTQFAQIFDRDSQYASAINIISVVLCMITMPVMVFLYEFIFSL